MKSLVTPRESPKPATIKANSPICAILIPTCTDCFRGCPEMIAPKLVKISFPKIVSRVTIKIAHLCSYIEAGSIIIPIEMKKIVANRFFTDLKLRSIFSA